ncbi:MAG: hypothetical protein LiPW15_828 [Parcubacteria group bacterium LiPW_15]|nr:MAG: hypothetical protein LiPW15_828 [Parcubacteria group bacterium LiPW_15]
MKSLIAGLIILAGLATGYYFFFYKQGNNPVGSSYETFLNRLKALGELKDKTIKTAQDVNSAVQAGTEKFQSIKDFFEKTSEAVSSTISDIKSRLPEGVLDFLSSPQKEASEKLSGFIAINSVSATPAKDLEGSICAQFSKNSKVEYSVANPFSPARDYQYFLDWGDGSRATGTILAADPPFFVQHAYAISGIFQNVFKITSATSTLGAEVKICVN